jgi:hypothetical protein
MSSRINVFQRLARQWDQVHPYNAAQVLKIAGVPPVVELHGAWHDALNDMGGSDWRHDALRSSRGKCRASGEH